MSEPDGLTAVLLQLSGIARQVADLDHRQAADVTAIGNRVGALATVVSDVKATVAEHDDALTAVAALDKQVTDLAGGLDQTGERDSDPAGYQPAPAPPFWKLDGAEREAAIGRLRAWVDQVYRPGYGHLAASLGECWEQHPLCLYLLDWLSELWSLLYLQPARTARMLAGQAEWHTRLLAGAAEQLASETRRCGHVRNPRSALAWPEVRP